MSRPERGEQEDAGDRGGGRGRPRRGGPPSTSTRAPASACWPASSPSCPTATATTTPPLLAPLQVRLLSDKTRAAIDEAVGSAPVVLFMKGTPETPQCGFSRQMVAILRERSVKYGFFNILADDEVRQGLKEFADWPTYPQLWVDGELVGGLDIVSPAPLPPLRLTALISSLLIITFFTGQGRARG